VAEVSGTSNSRRMISGRTGLGATAGNASDALVKIVVNPSGGVMQLLLRGAAVHVRISNMRRAVKRFWPAWSAALTWTRLTSCVPPERSTVTCLLATGKIVLCQFVPSVSSMSPVKLAPSPVAVAPFVVDAWLRGNVIATVVDPVPENVVRKRKWPWPGAWT
jgi:hypothetical protein